MLDTRLLLLGFCATPVLGLAALPAVPDNEASSQEASSQGRRGELLRGAPADSPRALFHRAYYVQHELGHGEEALALYEKVLETSHDAELRIRARRAADGLREDLAASDLARLMPANTLAYFELQDSGERLLSLLEELGLINDGSWRTSGQAEAWPGISPHLVRGMTSLRGAALGVLPPNFSGEPSGLAILHPGGDAMARGLAETIVQNGALPADSINGCATWHIPGQLFITFSQRLIFASPSKRVISQSIQRLRQGGKSFLDSEAMRATADLRGEDLGFFCLNMAPVSGMAQLALNMATAQEPRLRAFTSLVDPASLQAIAGRVGLGGEGVGVDLAMQLKEGHSNLAYNFFRMPSVDEAVLDLVPEGTAFVMATGLNEPSGGVSAGLVDSKDRAVVTWMDMGREIFGNLVDVVLFGMPMTEGEGLPPLGAILRVSDTQRSFAMWDMVLGLATRGSVGQEPQDHEIVGTAVRSYSIDGFPVHLAVSGDELVVSPHLALVERALVARERGFAAQQDRVLAHALEPFESGRTLALVASPGRLAEMVDGFLPFEQRGEWAQLGELLGESVLSMDMTHSETRCRVHMGISRVPNLGPWAAQGVASWVTEKLPGDASELSQKVRARLTGAR